MKLTGKVGVRHVTVGILVLCTIMTAILSFVLYSEGDTADKFVNRFCVLDEIAIEIAEARYAAEAYVHHHDSSFLRTHDRLLASAIKGAQGLSNPQGGAAGGINGDNEDEIEARFPAIVKRLEEVRLLSETFLNDRLSGHVNCLYESPSIVSACNEALAEVEGLEALLQRAHMEDIGDARLAIFAQMITCMLVIAIGLFYFVQTERGIRRSAVQMEGLVRRLVQIKKLGRDIENQSRMTQFSIDHDAAGILWTDRNANIVYANRAASRLTGYEADELRRMTVDQIDPGFPPERYSLVWQTLKESGSIVVPTSILTKSGSKRPVEVSANYLEHNGREYAIVTVRDVTDLELVRQNLEESRQRYREVVDSVDVGIALVDADERFAFANRKAEEIYGVAPGTLTGRSLAEFMHPTQFRTCLQESKKRAQGERSEYDLEIMRPNGEQRLIHLNANPRFLEDGTFVGTFGVFEDMTDKKRIVEEREQLEHRLQRSEKMESLGLLAGGVAHDLNNILGPLVAYPEMILRKLPTDSPVIGWVHKIETSAQLAADVIQDLLTMARRGRYEMKPTNINEVIKAFVDSPAFVRAVERNPGIAFTLNLDPRIALIEGSAPHLSKTFMNIIQNAFEATESGGSVSVSTTQRQLDRLSTGFEVPNRGEYVAVRVVDTGSGIADEDISKIFEPYFSKKKMGASGSGLGLAVVYGVVKDHGGYLDVISRVGKGTEFLLYFPLTTKRQEVAAPKANGKNLGELAVIVVGDDAESRELNGAILQSVGLTADSATSEVAMQGLQNSNFDCGIIDLPSGQEGLVAAWLKATRAIGIDIPFIFLAHNTEAAERALGAGYGSSKVLRKPYKPSDMLDAIHELVAAKVATPTVR